VEPVGQGFFVPRKPTALEEEASSTELDAVLREFEERWRTDGAYQ
jgi:hypothetical protein